MLPANEGLEPDDTAANEVDLGLIMEQKLAALERAAQIGLEVEAIDTAIIHPCFQSVETVIVSAIVLGLARSDMGVLQQRRRILAVIGVDADAHACRDKHLAIL